MDFNHDRISESAGTCVIALSHYFMHPCGDMIPDPDMTIRIFPGSETAEALTYQDTYRYDEVYTDGVADEALKKSLNTLSSAMAEELHRPRAYSEGRNSGVGDLVALHTRHTR